jgi:hypothetical protein
LHFGDGNLCSAFGLRDAGSPGQIWKIFLHDTTTYPVLIHCGLAHAQLETIQPFLDGNGRVGRLPSGPTIASVAWEGEFLPV